ncbi:MAG: hypothetical protein RR882_01295 [Comamonas sp.]
MAPLSEAVPKTRELSVPQLTDPPLVIRMVDIPDAPNMQRVKAIKLELAPSTSINAVVAESGDVGIEFIAE